MKISVDMEKAREIWRDNIRAQRQPIFERLDVEYLRAVESQNNVLKSDIEARKQALRDAPADARIEQAITPEDLKLIDPVKEITTVSELDAARLEKLQLLDAAWKQILRAGWETPEGWRLGLDISDVSLLMGVFTLAKEAAEMGITTPVSVIDIDGQAHALLLAELVTLMLAYGQTRAALSAADAEKRRAILTANTREELDAIAI